jgi:outer membrane protein OmpA-like peptidoglycan-associated protein
MLKPILTAACAVLLLAACEPKQAVVAAASPATAQPAQTFMLFFAFDQASLMPEAQGVVHEAALAAKARRAARITVAGNADTYGDATYNMTLSQRRAAAVKEALVQDGIDPAAISVVGHGEEELLVSTKDRVREPKNRRVEIMVQ